MAYTLTFFGEQDSRTVELSSELSVGRTSNNDVVLSDQGVSRKHCRFFIGDDGQAYVEDLGSANGVQVNGKNIDKPTAVTPESEINIGKTRIQLEDPSAPKGGRAEAEQALAVRDQPQEQVISRRSSRSRSRDRDDGDGEELAAPSSRRSPSRNSSRAVAARPSRTVKASSRGKLKCLSGPAEGETFDLTAKARLVVGRCAPADIILNDKSIAKKHAEIYKVGSSYSIFDLGSSGGTKVNGEAITEMQLCPGDEITMGDYVFQYTGPGALREAAGGGSSKIKIVLGAVVGLVLVGVVGSAVLSEEEEYVEPDPVMKPKTMSGADRNDDSVDPLRLLGRCKALSDIEGEQLNFKEAVAVCGKVLELDPSLTEARALKRMAEKEVRFAEIIDQAKLKASTSQDEAAIDLLLQIEPDSTAFTSARMIFKETSERLAKRMRTQCLTEFKSRYYQQAYDACKRYRELICNTEPDNDKTILKNFAESAKKTKSDATFVCPDKYSVFGTRVVYDASNIEDTIRKHYSNKVVAELIVDYYKQGRPKKTADDLKRAKAKNPRAFDAKVDDLILKLEVIDGRYTSGQEGILRSDPGRAESFWNDAFEAEQQILPKGIESSLVREMKSQLAKIYFDQGEDKFNKEHYADAFKLYYKGYKYDPRNTDLLTKIANLETIANKLLRDPGCGNAQLAVDITIPKSGVNKRAMDMLDEYNCR